MEKTPLHIPFISDAKELKSMVGESSERARHKVIPYVDSHVQQFIAMSPLFFLSTSDRDGKSDVSPRGDSPGFVHVLDPHRLVYPERPGNRRIDSLLNILSDPGVGMLFVIPGLNEVLRINGTAKITKDEEFITGMNWSGKKIGAAVIVEVEECFMHCPRAFDQAGLWDTATWAKSEHLPSMSEMIRAHLQINGLN
ncbi:MSMEG_1061 family FMN-dependent PPOX-type flavoprotein [Paenibacillus silvae]|uniref:MSMEG_1061 family FMN-dependent PPOX-type flavoprotein n=1 Tax=Paenibacillus silvae TaxID=1325358 RepID=UPI002004E61E|nr:MSMEG_1061 family FMN-dependent PPOX-type flavoprotein [Paenibacillus silvae]MCK6074993.1 pyridoxamine 5'-phosphate oxidase family protein [Paenibacillus silvae]MCK6149380.1 pyridoxamine 5'-phosphate oxidase family protein [Paenibacillus silvae]MCK6267679.1 pyridoxamine 5'-phosphate oxidase family protein [Paenibacillus silvae]